MPLDPSYPEDRLNFMLEDTGASILVTDSNISRGGFPIIKEFYSRS